MPLDHAHAHNSRSRFHTVVRRWAVVAAGAVALAVPGAAHAGPTIPNASPNETGVPTPAYNCGGCSLPAPWERLDDDRDGLSNGTERQGVYVASSRRGRPPERLHGPTDPSNPDTDGDGLPDGFESKTRYADYNRFANRLFDRTNPTRWDSDGDGLNDGYEVRTFATFRTSPVKRDTDMDGLSDGEEITTFRTNPAAKDTDGDGMSDRDEVRYGSDPRTPAGQEIIDLNRPSPRVAGGGGTIDLNRPSPRFGGG